MKLLKIEPYLKLIVTLVSILILIGSVFAAYYRFVNKLDHIDRNVVKIEQISLKAMIWNSEVPLVERLGACDNYLALGFNSYTKRYCESLLNNKDVVK